MKNIWHHKYERVEKLWKCHGFARVGHVQLGIHMKIQYFKKSERNCENMLVLQYLVIHNIDFIRKIQYFKTTKKSWNYYGFAIFGCFQINSQEFEIACTWNDMHAKDESTQVIMFLASLRNACAARNRVRSKTCALENACAQKVSAKKYHNTIFLVKSKLLKKTKSNMEK